MSNYLDNLKKTDLRPKKIKIDESKEEILLEKEDDRSMNDVHATIIKWFVKNPNPKDSQVRDFADEMGMKEDKIEEHIYMILTSLLQKYNITEAKVLQELFIQTGEIQGMDKGPDRDLKILRIGMIAELDAVNFYDELANLSSDERVEKLMLAVSHEEKVHAGEFETLMEELDPHYEEAEEEGEKEVEDLLGS